VEVAREKWDENDPNRNIDDSMDVSSDDKDPASNFRNILPDWTKTLLPQGAPSANVHATTPGLGGT
jgi:actin-related protein 10